MVKKPDLSRLFFFATVITVALCIAFLFGLYSGARKNRVYDAVQAVKADVKLVFEEIPNLSKTRPKDFLQPARYAGSGVTIDKAGDRADSLVLLSGFFDNNNELRLVRRSGDIVARWTVKFPELFPDTTHMFEPPETEWNIDLHGALALPDGSVVFNFDYGGLVKLDRCGSVVWTLAEPSHHSVELAEDGGFWVPGQRVHRSGDSSPFPPFNTPFREDTIMRVSGNGVVQDEISVPQLFYDNHLEALLTASGESVKVDKKWDNEIVHLNKIAELKREMAGDFPQFEAGDLMLSLRQYNMVLVIDPESRVIKWWKAGPWLRQHDPEFVPGGHIIVFNNNRFRTSFGPGNGMISSLDIPRISNIIEFDPASGEFEIVYGGRADQELLSVIRGKHERQPHGGLLITEFEGGRVLETDANGRIIWEYINRYDEDEVAELTEARVYPSSYFEVSDWSCEGIQNTQ
ncbi:MAG: arylsulfotransferase family protein [Pseudomonadota bacterium]|nr:arylsulfotransferase family protein [Pseudomonadota bacterium]